MDLDGTGGGGSVTLAAAAWLRFAQECLGLWVFLMRPLYVTLQAYRWKLHEQVHALLDRCVRPNAPLILWCDPWPDAVTLAAVKIVQILLRDGHAGPGVDAREAEGPRLDAWIELAARFVGALPPK